MSATGNAPQQLVTGPPLSGWQRERVAQVPNVITLVRTVASMALSVAAFYAASWPLLIAAYGVYWVGDILDGWTARTLHQETRIGAVFDIVCDRACTTLAAAAFLRIDPDSTWALGVFLFQFCVVDTMLTLSFLAYPIVSPNYFDRVDLRLYRLNWHPIAKALNTASVVILLLADRPLAAGLVAVGILVVKAYSVALLLRGTYATSDTTIASRA